MALLHVLRDLGISLGDAAVYFNLLPLQTRRDVAMMGVLHPSSLPEGPVCSQSIACLSSTDTRLSARIQRNTRQLVYVH